jgi:hypothetical protein
VTGLTVSRSSATAAIHLKGVRGKGYIDPSPIKPVKLVDTVSG